MTPAATSLDHILVLGRVETKERVGHGHGRRSIRQVDRRAHGARILGEAREAFASAEASRAQQDMDELLRATGTYLTLEGDEAQFPLHLDRLTSLTNHRTRRTRWLLLSVHPATQDSPERATIWVSDEFRQRFLALFESYLSEDDTRTGKPKNNHLVANIARIRGAFLRDLWTSKGEPPAERTWWELWLDARREQPGLLERVIAGYRLESLGRRTRVGDHVIVYVQATWRELEPLTATNLPLTEVRAPSFVDTVEDLGDDEQMEYVDDLAARVIPAPPEAPAVCHLDTGVFRGHSLLKASLASADQHTLIDADSHDYDGHGTSMAGLALYGEHLDDLLTGTDTVALSHRLESVRILTGDKRPVARDKGERDYASATIEAVARPPTSSPRRRVFCMPVSSTPDTKPGQPTLWSAVVDALAFGADIGVHDKSITVLTTPEQAAQRLIVVAAANVDHYRDDHLEESDLSPIENPGQAWNALTVGAFTDRDQVPSHPSFGGYYPLAPKGELSPHSRTSLLFGDRPWPAKPEICLEGGNVLADGHGDFATRHPLVSLRSTGIRNDVALTSANATSAATAQAARLATLAMARYPSYWPETIRALLVHEARWTPAMRRHLDECGAKKRARSRLLRRYGWGVPTEEAVLSSSHNAVTMVTQDEFRPFSDDFSMRGLRLHSLPWPRDVLQALDGRDVRLRLTLSYFIEPSPTRRGWKGRYAYASHGLRFALQTKTETADEFLRRVNGEAREEESSGRATSDDSERWFLGAQARSIGSLHQDEWTGTGAELAGCNHVAVYPVGGWWKNNSRKDRADVSIRYSLLLSLTTAEQEVDLYTPIATQLGLPIETVVKV